MRVSAVLMTGVCAMTLAACNENDGERTAPVPTDSMAQSEAYSGMQPMADIAQERKFAQSKQSQIAPSPPAPRQPSAENPSSVSYLAYRYNYGFSLPVKAVAATAKSHMQICMEAGPDTCQVLGSNTNVQNADFVTANLRLRAAPVWLEQFKDTLTTSVEASGGKTINAGVSAEDLTRQIVDTDARLKAQKILRTRLENLLETRNAKLPDLLSLERELARVQQQIESATTTLNVLRKRVSMSEVNISYQTKRKAVTPTSVSPIGRAFKAFTSDFSNAMGNVIRFIAAVLPWMMLIIPGVWFIRRWWRKRPVPRKNLPPRTPKA